MGLLEKMAQKYPGLMLGSMLGVVMGVGYLGATVAVNVTAMSMQAGIEALLDQPVQQLSGTLVKNGKVTLLSTHGELNYGDFRLNDGEIVRVLDTSQILEGKYFANTRMGNLKFGQDYNLRVKGSGTFGYSLLEMK